MHVVVREAVLLKTGVVEDVPLLDMDYGETKQLRAMRQNGSCLTVETVLTNNQRGLNQPKAPLASGKGSSGSPSSSVKVWVDITVDSWPEAVIRAGDFD
jgi:hypothetical protein